MKFQAVLAGALLLARTACAAPSSFPVCIVGAGPSGLVAASKLEAKGYSVVIFEKQDAVGGKSQSYYDPADGSYHPLGGLLFSNGTYIESLKVIAQTSVLSTPFNSGTRWTFNYTSGVEEPAAAPSADFVTLMTSEYQRYAQYWSTVWAPYNAMRYKNGVPAEFTVTCSEWLSTNEFYALPVLFIQAMVAFGYGDYRELPILYMLTYLTPDVLGYFASVHGAYLIDFHAVFVEYAKTIAGPIHLKSQISKIDRTGSNPVISYTLDNNTPFSNFTGALYSNSSVFANTSTASTVQSQTCASVILAFPPTVSSLTAANLALSPAEIDVFSPVLLNAYYSAAVNMPTVPYNLSFAGASDSALDPAPAAGEPVYWLRLFPGSSIATTWSWSAVHDAAAAYALLKSTLSLLNHDPRDPTSVPQPVTDADVRAFDTPQYFPHYDSVALAGGVYDRYNALQGQMNTFYCSALDGFEIVEFALRAGIDLVESYF